MYAPTKPEPEWIELFNPGTTQLQLDGWEITDHKTTATIGGSITPGGFLILTRDSSALRSVRSGAYAIIQLPLPSLNNTGDEVVLLDDAGGVRDSLRYDPSWGGSGGRSLERRSHLRNSTDPTNWSTSIDASGGTPGSVNSVHEWGYDLAIDSVTALFTPDSVSVRCRVLNVGLYDVDTCTVFLRSRDFSTSNKLAVIHANSSIDLTLSLPIDKSPESLTLIVDAVRDENFRNDTIRIVTNQGAGTRDIAINELMFAPTKPEPEWLELTNASHDTIDIGGWTLHVSHFSPITIPFLNSRIPPDSFVVLTSHDSTLATVRATIPSRVIPLPLPDLSNTASEIWLSDLRGVTIDSVFYQGSWLQTAGLSLERIDRNAPGSSATDWLQTEDSSGSTLLRPNSVRRRDHDLALHTSVDSLMQPSLVILNPGRDSSLTGVTVHIDIQALVSADVAITHPISPLDSIVVGLPLASPFFGKFIGSCYLTDSTDERHSNDTAAISLRRDVPADSLAITEILFAPRVGSCEWLEVYNTSEAVLSLDESFVVSRHGASVTRNPLPRLVLQPKSYGVIAANESFYTFYPELATRSQIVTLGKTSLSFANDSGFVTLQNDDSTSIDSARYNVRWQNPTLASTTGVSLERLSLLRSGNDSSNWASSSDSSGATPLAANTHRSTAEVLNNSIFSVQAKPNPFSPDADGFEDESLISVAVPNSDSYALRMRAFDQAGREVRTLADNLPFTQAATIRFDGRDTNGKVLLPGLYTLLIELNSPTAGSLQKRIGLAIAGKRR